MPEYPKLFFNEEHDMLRQSAHTNRIARCYPSNRLATSTTLTAGLRATSASRNN